MLGIGACSSALDRLGIEHEIVDAVEIDKYAMASFNAIHGTNFEVQDICTWDKNIECDLIMHGSPCQDFSLAGKQAGGDIGSGTRSSLMYETVRIVGKLRPKYVIWENVKNILSQKHKHNFDNYLTAMESLGYRNYYQVLNAKDYGIPQNRERVFTISIRKDIEKEFEFPPKQELKLRLKNMLEDEVDEKYYLSDEQMSKIKSTSNYVKDLPVVQRISGLFDNNGKTKQAGGIFDTGGLAPTLTDMQGGYRQPMIIASTHGNERGVIVSAAQRGRENGQQIEVSDREYANAITTVQKDSLVTNKLRIRKLTPKECFRLMRIY